MEVGTLVAIVIVVIFVLAVLGLWFTERRH